MGSCALSQNRKEQLEAQQLRTVHNLGFRVQVSESKLCRKPTKADDGYNQNKFSTHSTSSSSSSSSSRYLIVACKPPQNPKP